MLNLNSVYDWATHAVFDYRPFSEEYKPSIPRPSETPRLDFRAALLTGERLMAEQAQKHGFSVQLAVMQYRSGGDYFYFVKSSRDIRDKAALTYIIFDADTGALRSLIMPTGQHNGNTISAWLYALHMADVFGLPYRIFVCVLGLVIAMLSVTGVYIWWKKRMARMRAASQRRPSPGRRLSDLIPSKAPCGNNVADHAFGRVELMIRRCFVWFHSWAGRK